MKTIKKIGLVALAVLAVQACSDDFFKVNDSENSPVSSIPSLNLPVAQKMGADLITGSRFNLDTRSANIFSVNTLGNFWGYVWASSGNYIFFTDVTNYEVNSTFRPAVSLWESSYLNVLANYDFVDEYANGTADSLQYANYSAIAKIMKAYHYQYLVDAFGDVPYTQALERGVNTTPEYDEAQFVYNAIYEQLIEAQGLISIGLNDPSVLNVDGDIMLGGNMQMWGKLANSIKLRILLRQSETGVDLSAQYAELATNPFGFLGAGETVYANPGYNQDLAKQNPLWNGFGLSADGNLAPNAEATAPTDYVVQKLRDVYNDPRLDELYTPKGLNVPLVDPATEEEVEELPPPVEFFGIAQNQNQVNANAPQAADLSHVGPGVLVGAEQDAIIFSSYESLFLQAEAVQRGFLPGNAQDLYETAIAESFLQLDCRSFQDTDNDPNTPPVIAPDDPADYYSQSIANVGWAASPNKIEAIITQKWIALNGTNGFELWTEWRRTGYPSDLPSAPDATISTTIPVRLLYPASEVSTNAANTPDQTIDDAFNSPVFWDQ